MLQTEAIHSSWRDHQGATALQAAKSVHTISENALGRQSRNQEQIRFGLCLTVKHACQPQ
jgi:hypothetical protein